MRHWRVRDAIRTARRGFLSLALGVGLLSSGTAAAAEAPEETTRMNPAIEQLAADKPAIGIVSLDRDMLNADALGRSPLDFVVIDTEHHPFDTESVRQFIRNMRTPAGFRAAPLVRIRRRAATSGRTSGWSSRPSTRGRSA